MLDAIYALILISGSLSFFLAMYWKDHAYVRVCQAFWAVRLKRSAVIDVSAHPSHFVEITHYDLDMTRFALTEHIDIWCRENLRRSYGVAPSFGKSRWSQQDSIRIWFDDPNDAVAFKIRWG